MENWLRVRLKKSAFKWFAPGDLKKVDFSEADIIVADNYLQSINDEVTNTMVNEPDQSASDDDELRSMVNRMVSMKEAEWVATSAIENPVIFKKLIEYSFSADKKLANELSASVNMLKGEGSAGILARGRMIMKKWPEHLKTQDPVSHYLKDFRRKGFLSISVFRRKS